MREPARGALAPALPSALVLALAAACAASHPVELLDGGVDGGPRVRRDAGVRDAGRDGGLDTRRDGGVDGGCPEIVETVWGVACRRDGDCPGAPDVAGGRCIPERRLAVGGAEEPLVDPEGAPVDLPGLPVDLVAFPEGLCVFEPRGGCDDDADCRGRGGRCAPIEGERRCLVACDPLACGNAPCREGYRCDPDARVCLPGCTSDLECRIAREDTNGNGVIDPYDPATNADGDLLVYDVGSRATCDRETFRCTSPGTPDAMAGDACQRDSDCGPDGRCLTDASGYPDGMCVVDGCAAFGCGRGEICQSRGLGEPPVCLRACEFAAELGTDAERGPGGHGEGCRDGYRCVWSGEVVEGVAEPSGACLPGNYNAVSAPNMGVACTSDSQCWSRLGAGSCWRRDVNGDGTLDVGLCVLDDCHPDGSGTATPPNPLTEVVYCGARATCVDLADEPSTYRCMRRCTPAEGCAFVSVRDTSGVIRSGTLPCNPTIEEGSSEGVCALDCYDRVRGRFDSTMCRRGASCDPGTGLCLFD